jgi:hypothetical protein
VAATLRVCFSDVSAFLLLFGDFSNMANRIALHKNVRAFGPVARFYNARGGVSVRFAALEMEGTSACGAVASFAGPCWLRMLMSVAIVLILAAPGNMAQEKPTAGTTERRVLLLAPYLAFEKLQDESALDPGKFGDAALGNELSAAVSLNLRSNGFEILAATNLPAEADTLVGKLQPVAGRVARGSISGDSQVVLTDLTNKLGSAWILAQYLRVRVGGKGWWNPINGAIASGQSETLLAAALIRPEGGTVYWKNEILVRKVLTPGSKDLKNALSALLISLL